VTEHEVYLPVKVTVEAESEEEARQQARGFLNGQFRGLKGSLGNLMKGRNDIPEYVDGVTVTSKAEAVPKE